MIGDDITSDDLPTGDLPTGDLPTGDLPTGDLPTGDLPTGDLPTGDAELGDLTGLRDGQTRLFADLGEHGVVVCRVAGALYAVVDNCSHRDAKLSEGRLRGPLLTCPLHGAQFDVRTGAHQGPPAATPIACFAVTERNGTAFVRLDP